MQLTTHFEEITDPAVLEPRWRALEIRVEAPSFFLRWTWMGSWLGALIEADIALPQLLAIMNETGDEGDVALALVGHGLTRRKLGKIPAIWLNQAGHAGGDRPFIEYNGLLCSANRMTEAVHAFCEATAARRDWRICHLSGVAFGSLLPEIGSVRRRTIRDASPAYFVDLRAVRQADGDYLSLLSANSRHQIRRSLKEEPAKPRVEAVTDPDIADSSLSAMRRLNQGRHTENAWENTIFRDFMRRLVHAGIADGSVELLRVATDGETLGYLVNFLWAGRAMNYQSAFMRPRTPKSKPGLMCHTAAVTHYSKQGLDLYSFLAGKDRYKHSLSTGAEELHWWALERSDWRLDVEAMLRSLFKPHATQPRRLTIR